MKARYQDYARQIGAFIAEHADEELDVSACHCGACTIASFKSNAVIQFGPKTWANAAPWLTPTRDHKFQGCNHCINNWGIDLPVTVDDIEISRTELMERIEQNHDLFGVKEWRLCVDVNGNLECRHDDNDNDGWLTVLNFANLDNLKEYDADYASYWIVEQTDFIYQEGELDGVTYEFELTE